MRLGRGLLVAGAAAAALAVAQGALAWREARTRHSALRLALEERGALGAGAGVNELGQAMRRMLEASGAARVQAPVESAGRASAQLPATRADEYAGHESSVALRELRQRLGSVPIDDFVGRVEVLAEARRRLVVAPEELRELLLHELNVSAGRYAGHDDPARRAEFLGHQMSGLRFLLELNPDPERARESVGRALQAPLPPALHEELRRYADDQLRRAESARTGVRSGGDDPVAEGEPPGVSVYRE
jgi:hypothetical protein